MIDINKIIYAIMAALLGMFIFSISYLYKKNLSLQKELSTLGALCSKQPQQLEPIIKYKDKKIEIIKKIPIKDETCEQELTTLHNIINNF